MLRPEAGAAYGSAPRLPADQSGIRHRGDGQQCHLVSAEAASAGSASTPTPTPTTQTSDDDSSHPPEKQQQYSGKQRRLEQKSKVVVIFFKSFLDCYFSVRVSESLLV